MINIPTWELGLASGCLKIARFVPVRLGCKTVVVTAAREVTVHVKLKSSTAKTPVINLFNSEIIFASFACFYKSYTSYFGSAGVVQYFFPMTGIGFSYNIFAIRH
jgi:hypothetical protein